MKVQSNEIANELRTRLRRIEGQTRGVQKMLDEDRDCREILQQLKAIESATTNAKKSFMLAYAKDCLLHAPAGTERGVLIDQIIGLM